MPNTELRPLPRTPREAFWMLENACAYLRDYYHDEYSQKNGGWKENEGDRQAFAQGGMMHISYWILFAVGWLLHVLLQAKASVNSKSNSLESVRQWLKLSWLVLLVRAFVAFLFMLLWHDAPQLFGQVVGAAVPMTKATSGIFGLAVDAAVDKLGAIFGLKIEIPAVAPPQAEK